MEDKVKNQKDMVNKQLPKSKKALEYRVFWLERKLSHIKDDKLKAASRQRSAVVIDKLPDSDSKSLMHLNNEFNRAGEKLESLSAYTESLNHDSQQINERSERLSEITQRKITDAERLNTHSKRLLQRTHKLNQATVDATKDTLQTNTKTKLLLLEGQAQRDETKSLQKLSQAQYAANKTLNTKLETTQREAIETASAGLEINRQLDEQLATTESNNIKAELLRAELIEIKSELARMNEVSEKLQDATRGDLKEVSRSKKQNEGAIKNVRQAMIAVKKQIKQGQRQGVETKQLNDLTADKLSELTDIQVKASSQLGYETEEHERLRASVEADAKQQQKRHEARLSLEVKVHRDILQVNMEAHEDDLLDITTKITDEADQQQQRVAKRLAEDISQNKQTLNQASQSAQQHLEALSQYTRQSTEQSIKALLLETETTALDLNQQALASIDRFETESNADLMAFNHDSKQSLDAYNAESNEALETFDQQGKSLVEGFEAQGGDALDNFTANSDALLDRRTRLVESQDAVLDANLEKSEQFLEATRLVNQQSTSIIEEAKRLNEDGQSLQVHCDTALGEIEAVLKAVNNAKLELESDHAQLNHVTTSLNTETSRLQQVSGEINAETLKLQNDSSHTQALSEQINSQSLVLHDETRSLNNSFEQVKQENQTLLEHLGFIEQRLKQQQQETTDQLLAMDVSLRNNENINQRSEALQDQSKQLSDDTHLTLAEAKRVIRDTEEAKQSTLALSQDIHQAYVKLSLLEDDVKHAGEESREAAQQARQSVVESKQIHEALIQTQQQVYQLQQTAENEFSQLKTLKAETAESAVQSNQAMRSMQNSVTDARNINDEFLRGLEASTRAQQLTESNSQALMEETNRLQSEIKDMLSLKEGFHGFQQNIKHCQNRLDQYQDSLASCEIDGAKQGQLLNQYQVRIDDYQTDLRGFKDNVHHFSMRAEQLDTDFRGLSTTVDQLQENQDKQQSQLLKQQQQGLQTLKSEVEDELLNRQQQLDAAQRQLEDFSTDLASKLKLEVRRQTAATEQKVNLAQLELGRIDNTLKHMNDSIGGEVQTLKLESAELRQQNQAFLHQQEQNQAEFVEQQSSHELEIQEIKHRLKNYQGLLQSQIDNDQSRVIDKRMGQLESNIEQQRVSMEKQEDFQRKLIDQHPQDQLQELMDKFGRSMDEATEMNRNLKDTVANSERTNKSLLENNQKLQQRLAIAQKERDFTLKQYSERLKQIEEREGRHQKSISKLRNKESETKETMQEMRLAMKDSTDAMRETQRSLERFQATNTVSPDSWFAGSKQAVVNSVIAVLFLSLVMLGYDKVETLQAQMPNEIASIAAVTSPTSLALARQTPTAQSQIEAKNHADDSISSLGAFSWPVNFGIIDPNAIQYQAHRKGISISAEFGDPVVAVNNGKVVYSAKEIRGYGNVIVIQHDQHLVSVYANNQFNYVKEGDMVTKGQLIGDIGQLFDQDVAGLYFEMRYMGRPEDPFNYLSQNDLSFSQIGSGANNLNQNEQLTALADRG